MTAPTELYRHCGFPSALLPYPTPTELIEVPDDGSVMVALGCDTCKIVGYNNHYEPCMCGRVYRCEGCNEATRNKSSHELQYPPRFACSEACNATPPNKMHMATLPRLLVGSHDRLVVIPKGVPYKVYNWKLVRARAHVRSR